MSSDQIDFATLPSGFTSIDQKIDWRGAPRDAGDLFQFAYGSETAWKLVAEYDGEVGSAWVIANDPISYRVHDERELLAYWARRDEEGIPPAFGYEIARSIYLEEISRGVSGFAGSPLRHFVFGGSNQCLEIIARELPKVTYTRPIFAAK